MGEWSYIQNGQQSGPVAWSHLQQLVASGRLRPADLVWTNGMPSWAAAGSIPNLFPPTPAASSPPSVPPVPAATPANPPDAHGRVGKIIDFLQQANDLWRKLTLLQRIGVIAVAALVVVLFLVSTLIKATGGSEQGTSVWQVLMDLGVVSGAVGLAYGLLQKYLEKKLFSEAQATTRRERAIDERAPMGYTPKIEAGPGFIGLSAHQWLVTLHIVFIAGLAGAILAGFLLGASSLWVNGAALVVVGGLIAVLSARVSLAYDKQLRKAISESSYYASDEERRLREEDRTRRASELKMSVLLGVSILVPTLISVWMSIHLGKYAAWVYFVYGALLFLPELHVLTAVARGMQPIRHSAGLWISGAYLVGMFALCAVIAMTISKPDTPVHSPYADKIVGNWLIVGRTDLQHAVEFTSAGSVVYYNPYGQETGRYWFTAAKSITLKQEGNENVSAIDIDFVNDDEIVAVQTKSGAFFEVSGTLKRVVEPRPAAQPQQPQEIDSRFVGTWELTAQEQKLGTMEITKNGRYVYRGIGKGRGKIEDADFNGEVRVEDKDTVALDPGRFGHRTIEYISQDELLLANDDYGIPSGTLKRKK